MLLQEILRRKCGQVQTIGPTESLHDAACKLIYLKIGALMVASRGRVLGILTERDILRARAARCVPLKELRVGEIMSTKLVTATPYATLETAMRLMTLLRVRHLPIIVNRRLCGIVSIDDLMQAQYEQLEAENGQMRKHIQCEAAETAPVH